jgi:hypothetical protein
MIAILNSDVFPGLEKQNPMESKEEDLIPDKFGSKWYEHQDKKVFAKVINNEDDDFDIAEQDLLEDT